MKRACLIAIALCVGCGGEIEAGDGAVALGQRQLPGYRIDAAADLALATPGFGVTALAAGRYRLSWQGTSSDVLSGQVTTDGAFDTDLTSPLGGKELVANTPSLISFTLSPTAEYNGLELATSAGPIYLDLVRNADRAGTAISFLRGGQQQRSAHNPVAIELR